MFILYNDQLLLESELRLPLTDRAFQYNDGFFETAILVDGRIRFWQQHQQRMQEAAEALRLELPLSLAEGRCEEKLLQLARQAGAEKYGRIKLKVWRAGAGLYTPETSRANWLASITPAAPAVLQPLHLGICQSVHSVHTPLSGFKGPNAPLYVLAGLEKQQRHKDDMLLLNSHGMVAELTSSNIFWLKHNTLYTPDLQTGCVNGILRRIILKWGSLQRLQVQEVLQAPEELLHAEAVFCSNVTGIRAVASINGQALRQRDELLLQLRSNLLL
ncbi:aminotransferase class IV [Pontibacter litorisediminis]|uniref:aminotransferase class IV n=1 Tax=Pontibacter litorisediminis TaxID=1846260 RepID=UPI0023ED346E|nr:aminotransferase class IV [Pontibacter litorisediminis]